MKRPGPLLLSARKRKLWIWAASIGVGTLAIAILASRYERFRATAAGDAHTAVSATFTDAAIARESLVRFTDVTAQSGIRMPAEEPPRHRSLPEDNGTGLAWGDYNGDGWPDLYVVRHTGGNRLFRNNGNGTFTDVTEQAGVGNPADFGMGATWVDFDDDGLLDLYVTNRGPNRLYKNMGNGTFVDVAPKAGVADPGWGTGTAWGDFDRDGHIDFYLCNYVNYDSDGLEPAVLHTSSRSGYEAPFTLNPNSYSPQPNRLFRNRGDGTFEDVTARCGVADPDGRSLGATFCDLHGNGWLDLFVVNDASPNRLYRNTGGDAGRTGPISFVDGSAAAGVADPRSSMGLSVGKVRVLSGDEDTSPDVFVTHWVAQGNALYERRVDPLGQIEDSLDPLGKLEYRDVARPRRLGEISLNRVGWGCALADFDLDGLVDIAVANGSTLEREDNPLLLKSEPMFIFMNDGAGFRDVAPLAGEATRKLYNARGLAVADFNHDGRLDIAIMTTEGVPVLLRNDTLNGNRSLTIRLKGRAAYCFGAKVEIWVGGRRQIRWYGSDVSYLSMHSTDMIFGLGRSDGASRVRVTWVDGKVSTMENVSAGYVEIDHATAPGGP
jgi:hypothetical protein